MKSFRCRRELKGLMMDQMPTSREGSQAKTETPRQKVTTREKRAVEGEKRDLSGGADVLSFV